MKFKTNAICKGCKATILEAMKSKFPDAEWDMDMESADKYLMVHGIPEDSDTAAQVEKTLEETGFKGAWVQND